MFRNDVIDILGIDSSEQTPPEAPRRPTKVKKAPKRPGGRKNTVDYVRQLLPDDMGINPLDIVSQIGEPPANHLELSFKKFGKKPVRKWTWGQFTNSARTDGLVLNHWKRIGAKAGDYPFAQLNKREPTPSYTDAVYKVLMDVSEVGESDWSKEETDYLVKLADEYHLTWPVIADRYDFPNGPKRSLDDLRARFHLVDDAVKFLHGYKGPSSDFNYEEEVKRKRQLKNYIFRTQEQLEEEKTIVEELDRIRKRDREFLIGKRRANIERIAKVVASQRVRKRVILAAKKASSSSKLNVASPRRLLSPRLDLAPPGGLDFETMANFGLTSKPIKKLAVSTKDAAYFASEAADVSFGQHVSKQPLIRAVYDYYYPLTFPQTISNEFADNSTEFRSKIHCISELKGAFMSLTSELARLEELEKAAGFTSEPLPPEHTVQHYMKDRVTEDGKRTYESMFHIVPPTFPMADCIKFNNNGLPVRNASSSINYPKELSRTRRSSTVPSAFEQQRLSPPPPSPPKTVVHSAKAPKRPGRESLGSTSSPAKKSKNVVRASDIGAPPMTVVSPKSEGRPARAFRPKQLFSPKK
uniref:Myb-like domain-containing protein n=1 Tax=Panagrellus redivivus TaxID=6233 RepID=A0A7E4ZUX3_PANRE